MTSKLRALSEVNKKITEIQNMYQVKMNSEEGFIFNFEIPEDEREWFVDDKLGSGSLYKRIKLHNSYDETINLVLLYGKRGCKIKKHNHEEPHIMICVDGKASVEVDDNEFIISKGQSIYINPFQWHKMDFLVASKFIILYI